MDVALEDVRVDRERPAGARCAVARRCAAGGRLRSSVRTARARRRCCALIAGLERVARGTGLLRRLASSCRTRDLAYVFQEQVFLRQIGSRQSRAWVCGLRGVTETADARTRRGSGQSRSASRTCWTGGPIVSRAAKDGGSASRVRCVFGRRSCCSTSRSRDSTNAPTRASARRTAAVPRGFDATTLLVTHSRDEALGWQRSGRARRRESPRGR